MADYQENFPAVIKCLRKDLEEFLTALKFPSAHRSRIQTTNLLDKKGGLKLTHLREKSGRGERKPFFVGGFIRVNLGFCLVVLGFVTLLGCLVPPLTACPIYCLVQKVNNPR